MLVVKREKVEAHGYRSRLGRKASFTERLDFDQLASNLIGSTPDMGSNLMGVPRAF